MLSLLFTLLLTLAACSLPGSGQTTGPAQRPAQRQAQGEYTYVAIGASDTFGLGAREPYTSNWASDLAHELGPHYHMVNLGILGIRLHQALDVELPIALDAHPDLVTIWLAVNDIAAHVPADNYDHDLDTLLSRLRANSPHARIAVANVPDLTQLPGFYRLYLDQNQSDQSTTSDNDEITDTTTQEIQAQIEAYNTAISRVVRQHTSLLVDLSPYNTDLKNHPEYISQDGLHPTSLGYQRLAELFYQVLQSGKG